MELMEQFLVERILKVDNQFDFYSLEQYGDV
jgi:hypothetical protein